MLALLALATAGLAAATPIRVKEVMPIEARQTSTDPCGRLKGFNVFTPAAIANCLRTVPFNPAVRTNLMTAADVFYTQLDPFQYNQLGDTEESQNQGVDLQAEFKRINGTTYASDYDFQYDLSQSLQKLNDGHAAWTSCYRSYFYTSHAIPIVSYSSLPTSTENSVYIAPDVQAFVAASGFSQYYASQNINVAALAGARVISIDGQPAWDWLEQDLLPRAGIYTDKQQRMNSLFASYSATSGGWGREPGRFTTTNSLTRNNITLTVVPTNGAQTTVVIPFLVRYQSRTPWNYDTAQQFWNAVCDDPLAITASPFTGPATPANGTRPSTAPINGTTQADLNALAQRLYRACPIDKTASTFPVGAGASDPTTSPAYLGGRDAMFFRIPNTKNGVVYLSTFMPDSASTASASDESCIYRYIIDLVYGLQNFTAAGVENVLIDTSNNGGGYVALSQVAQVLFTGSEYTEEAGFPSVLRKSPLTQALLQRYIDNPRLETYPGSFNPAQFRSSNTSTASLPRNANYFNPGSTMTINGQSLAVSNWMYESTETIDLVNSIYKIPNAAPFAPKNIVITGNGLCGSACATFTNFMIEQYNTTAYIQAAQPSKPIEYAAFMAGQASTSRAIYNEAIAIGLTSNSILPKLNYFGQFAFALRAGISTRLAPGEFLQYRSHPADKRFALTRDTYLDQVAVWKYTAEQVFR